jgi:hypothetical protein
MTNRVNYHIEGSYYEACNCDAICPCRKQNGVATGRSTYGTCEFLLSWHIERGNGAGIDLAGLDIGIAGRYNDDEDGKPWSVIIYIDESARDDQFAALAEIFQGKAGGSMTFTAAFFEILGVKYATVALDHTAGHERIRIGDIASSNVLETVAFDGTISCGIPGHDRPGHETVSNLSCHDGPLQWDYEGRCGFATDFAYSN